MEKQTDKQTTILKKKKKRWSKGELGMDVAAGQLLFGDGR